MKIKKRFLNKSFVTKKPQGEPVEHQGETVEDFLARGGQIKKVQYGVADFAIGFTTKWPGGTK